MPHASNPHATTVFTVDVGNTSTHFGAFRIFDGDEPELLDRCELATNPAATKDEARIQLGQVLELMGRPVIEGSILSCVVPSLSDPWRRALASACADRPLVVGPGLKTGISLRFDDPGEVGSDRIADAVAVRERYGAPALAIDLGTTTNFEIIDSKGAFCGGIIAPGVALGAQSLSQAAARLPMIELRAPKRAIGRNTREAMQSGTVLGEAARIDGLIDILLEEMADTGLCDEAGDVPIAITGTGADRMAHLIAHDAVVDEALTLYGLALLWQRNRR